MGFKNLRIGGSKAVGVINSIVVVSVISGYIVPLIWMRNQTQEQSREANAKFLEYVKVRFAVK